MKLSTGWKATDRKPQSWITSASTATDAKVEDNSVDALDTDKGSYIDDDDIVLLGC